MAKEQKYLIQFEIGTAIFLLGGVIGLGLGAYFQDSQHRNARVDSRICIKDVNKDGLQDVIINYPTFGLENNDLAHEEIFLQQKDGNYVNFRKIEEKMRQDTIKTTEKEILSIRNRAYSIDKKVNEE